MSNLEGVDKEMASKAAQEARKATSRAINAKGRATERRQPGEVRSRKDAIRSFCSECITMYGLDNGDAGTIKGAIEACPATECHLWPWRGGPLDKNAAK